MNIYTIATVALVIMKLTDNIDWPWLIVLSPFLINLALTFCAVIFIAGVAYLGTWLESRR